MAEVRVGTDSERLVCAVLDGDTGTALELLAREPALARTVDAALHSTPLHMAAHRGQLAVVERLLAAGADVHAREGCSGTTALHWAAEGGRVAIVERLLAAGAELEARDIWHALTPLDWAVCVDHAPHLHEDRAGAAACLEAHGAAPSAFTAIVRGDAHLLQVAVARDAQALARRLGPADGESTPLAFALRARAAPMVAALLELGADAGATARGLSPRALAFLPRDDAALTLLEARGARDDLSAHLVRLERGALDGDLGRAPRALVPGGPYGTLLSSLALFGLAEPAREALARGADANAPTLGLGVDEWLAELPPLFLAVGAGAGEVARALLEHGAQVNARAMRANLTPLHVAALRNRRGVAQLLLEHGADRSARDANLQATPAGWAAHAGHTELAAELE
jgi:ankyrin repeat protein